MRKGGKSHFPHTCPDGSRTCPCPEGSRRVHVARDVRAGAHAAAHSRRGGELLRKHSERQRLDCEGVVRVLVFGGFCSLFEATD